MHEMREQTTNLNVDDFCALRCFDSNKSISHITWDNQGNMNAALGDEEEAALFEEEKLNEINNEWLLGLVNDHSV